MENLFDAIPTAHKTIETTKENKETEIKKQIDVLVPHLKKLNINERITVNFPIIQELRENLYHKGYNTIVNGNESIIEMRDPKEDMFDEWTTSECGR